MPDNILKNPQAVLAYLKDSGRKVGKSKVYEDIKLGALRCQTNGTFRKRDVDVYAASLIRRNRKAQGVARVAYQRRCILGEACQTLRCARAYTLPNP